MFEKVPHARSGKPGVPVPPLSLPGARAGRSAELRSVDSVALYVQRAVTARNDAGAVTSGMMPPMTSRTTPPTPIQPSTIHK
jgi:hypothetical protein